MILVPHLPYRTSHGVTEPAINIRAFGDDQEVVFVENTRATAMALHDFNELALDAASTFDPNKDKLVMVGHPVKQALVMHHVLTVHGHCTVGIYDKLKREYKYERCTAIN